MLDKYHIALAYSNIQELYGLPIIISGIIVNDDDLTELEKKDLPSKRALQQRKDTLFELQSAFNDIDDYITQFETSRILFSSDYQADMESNYLKILRVLRKKRLHVISGKITSISIRCLENPKNWAQPVPFSEGFIEEVSKYSEKVALINSGEFGRLLRNFQNPRHFRI